MDGGVGRFPDTTECTTPHRTRGGQAGEGVDRAPRHAIAVHPLRQRKALRCSAGRAGGTGRAVHCGTGGGGGGGGMGRWRGRGDRVFQWRGRRDPRRYNTHAPPPQHRHSPAPPPHRHPARTWGVSDTFFGLLHSWAKPLTTSCTSQEAKGRGDKGACEPAGGREATRLASRWLHRVPPPPPRPHRFPEPIPGIELDLAAVRKAPRGARCRERRGRRGAEAVSGKAAGGAGRQQGGGGLTHRTAHCHAKPPSLHDRMSPLAQCHPRGATPPAHRRRRPSAWPARRPQSAASLPSC